MNIPAILHQTWKTADIPRGFEKYAASWRRLNPGWRYHLWTDQDCRSFVRERYPAFLALYDSYTSSISRADAARYLLLHHYGGLYADLDSECLRPFDSLLRGSPGCIIGCEPRLHAERLYGRSRLVCNAVLLSAPGHPFWEHVLSVLVSSAQEKSVIETTGPVMLDRALGSYPGHDVSIVADSVFCPLVDLKNSRLRLTPTEKRCHKEMLRLHRFPDASYAVHYWAGTWYRRGIAGKLVRLATRLRAALRLHSNGA
ncbi:MAG: hypothetical protein FJ119_07695 [Deltaproteobacteria bacterium]|nr:hypothetical protein [Deltaproteobacteria bacterium]